MHSTKSRHLQLEALASAKAWNFPSKHTAVPPSGTAWENGDDLVYLVGTEVRDHHGEASIDVLSTIPYDTPGVLVVSYLYRDASNYKESGSCAIRGSLSRTDIAALITALTAGDDGCFVPAQLGMQDLQQGWTDDDHIWHEVTDLAWRPTGEADIDWSDIAPLCHKVLRQGYNIADAMEAHMDEDAEDDVYA